MNLYMNNVTNFIKNRNLKEFRAYFAYIGLLLIFCVSANIFMCKKLNEEEENLNQVFLQFYADEIRRLILKDFQKIFQRGYRITDLSIIKNFNYEIIDENKKLVSPQVIYSSNNTLHIQKENKYLIIDLLNVKKILDDLSRGLFLYTLKINDKEILTNTSRDLTNNVLLSALITQDIALNISLRHHKNSPFIILNETKIKTQISQILYLSVIIFFIGALMLFLLSKQKRALEIEKTHKKNILLFLDKSKEFVIQCYEYSKNFKLREQDETKEEKGYSDYFPLAIAFENQKNKKVILSIDKIVEPIREYFVCYKAHYQLNNIELDIVYLNLRKIAIPFDYEVFYQIVVSIICNLINFNKKSSSRRKIVINFKKAQITISSEGLKLNKEYAIKASEMIFQDYANPYLMNFGQIFVIFNKFNIKTDVFYENNGTVISKRN